PLPAATRRSIPAKEARNSWDSFLTRLESRYVISLCWRLLHPFPHPRMLPQAGQPAVNEHADVPFLLTDDFRNLPVGKSFNPQVQGLPLGGWQMLHHPPQHLRQLLLLRLRRRVAVRLPVAVEPLSLQLFERFQPPAGPEQVQ